MSRRLKIQNFVAIAAGWGAVILFAFDRWTLGYVLAGVCVVGLIAFVVENQIWMRKMRRDLDEMAERYRPQ